MLGGEHCPYRRLKQSSAAILVETFFVAAGKRGYEAAENHSDMPPEKRAEVLQKVRSGILDCVVQVQILGEGFDHPHLSVAAIFRPFRSLSPYVQFVGRTMRVVVQNDPRHPDNYGYVVAHVGMNLDQQLADFRDMEREDGEFFEDLLSGAEPGEPPPAVLDGTARQRLREDMVVQQEIVDEFFQEEFVQPDDATLIAELKAHAESLGFDAEAIDAMVSKASSGKRRVPATPPFAMLPQRQRQEARRRLNEEVKRAAKLLLNRLGLPFGGSEMSFRIAPGVSGSNFAAAVQLVNRELDKVLGTEPGRRGGLRAEDFTNAINTLDQVLILSQTKRDVARLEQEASAPAQAV